jgi:hypothetical protein
MVRPVARGALAAAALWSPLVLLALAPTAIHGDPGDKADPVATLIQTAGDRKLSLAERQRACEALLAQVKKGAAAKAAVPVLAGILVEDLPWSLHTTDVNIADLLRDDIDNEPLTKYQARAWEDGLILRRTAAAVLCEVNRDAPDPRVLPLLIKALQRAPEEIVKYVDHVGIPGPADYDHPDHVNLSLHHYLSLRKDLSLYCQWLLANLAHYGADAEPAVPVLVTVLRGELRPHGKDADLLPAPGLRGVNRIPPDWYYAVGVTAEGFHDRNPVNEDTKARVWAVEALSRLPASQAAEKALRRAARLDLKPAVRQAGLAALKRLKSRHAEGIDAAMLVEVVQDAGEKLLWRREAALQLAQPGPHAEGAIAVLLPALKDEPIAMHAAIALWRLGPNAQAKVQDLLDKEKGPESVRRTAALVLGKKSPSGGLVELLQAPDAKTRLWAVRQIVALCLSTEKIQKNLALSLAAVSQTDTDSEVRATATVALIDAGITPESATPRLLDLLREEKASPGQRTTAAKILGQLGECAADAEPALIAALASTDKELRFWSAWALGQTSGHTLKSVPALKALQLKWAKDDPILCEVAEQSIVEIQARQDRRDKAEQWKKEFEHKHRLKELALAREYAASLCASLRLLASGNPYTRTAEDYAKLAAQFYREKMSHTKTATFYAELKTPFGADMSLHYSRLAKSAGAWADHYAKSAK